MTPGLMMNHHCSFPRAFDFSKGPQNVEGIRSALPACVRPHALAATTSDWHSPLSCRRAMKAGAAEVWLSNRCVSWSRIIVFEGSKRVYLPTTPLASESAGQENLATNTHSAPRRPPPGPNMHETMAQIMCELWVECRSTFCPWGRTSELG